MAIPQTDNVVALRAVTASAVETTPLLAATAAMTQALERFAAAAQGIGAATVEDEARARLMTKLGEIASQAAELQLAIVSLHFGL